jgi:hypothetical protein
MTCGVCGKTVLHGSHLGGKGGTYLGESGCHDGVWMDDDEYAEGWADDTIYRPCPNHPKCCKKCGGTGTIFTWSADKTERYYHDCTNKTCRAGWKGEPEWPVSADDEALQPKQVSE